MAANSSHERNLLFAGLGLQLSLLTKEQLVRAFSEWILNKNLSLGEILVQQKAITPEQQKTIEGAIDLQIQNDGGEVQALASVKNAQEIETSLKNIEDQELEMTLCTMHALQSRKMVGKEVEQERMNNPWEFNQTLPGNKPLEQRFQRKHFLDGGNLGEIWFAKDGELNRTVVLKYIKGEQQGNPFTKALFNLEGEVTGYLEHPAVVPVYSMCQDDKGRSFYAMRYIRGRKLTRTIADYHGIPASSIGKRREALTELLQAFQTACLAIEYAHSKGVLHCDLKPDNIVVGPFGETLVIDWGLAMVTNPPAEMAQEIKNLENMPIASASGEMAGPYSPSQSARPGLHSSQGGMRKFVGGTPAYMAPEQMRATRGGEVKEVTILSDIFSLGATLYHLLTSQAPFIPSKEKGELYAKYIQRIEKGEFPRPQQLNPSIPKPMEAVVLKAMAANPADRYGSARELAGEVKRWLADEPVNAYLENSWERSRRWARNHRSTVVAGVVLLLCFGIGGAGFGLVTQGLIEKLQKSEGESRNQESLAKENEKKALTQERLAKESEQKALIQERLAKEQMELVEKREAMAIAAVKQYADVVKKNPELKNRKELEPLRRELLREGIHFFKDLSNQIRSEKIPSLKSLNALGNGLYSLGPLTGEAGNKEDAIRSFLEAIAVQEILVKQYPGYWDYLEWHNTLTLSHLDLGILFQASNRPKEAEENFQKALAIQGSLVKQATTGSILRYQIILSHIHNHLAGLYFSTNRLKEGEENFHKALAIQESLVKSNPTISGFQIDLAETKNALAWKLVSLTGNSEADFQKGLHFVQEALKLNPEDGLILNTLGVAQYRLRQFAPALESLQKSNATNSNASGKEDPSDLAFLAMTCQQLNKKDEAENYFKKLREAMKDKKNSENKEYQGFFKEAESLLKK